VVAFLWGPSRGSVFTAREAIRAGKPAAVVLAGGGAVLPAFGGGRWAAWTGIALGGVGIALTIAVWTYLHQQG
jgi:hypothetical protein